MQEPSLSLHSTPVHKFSASKIEETVLENLCSNLLLLEAHSCLHLLHLTCVFLKVCHNGSSLKPVRPMCDGRPFASPLFRRLAGRGAFFCGFPFQWGPTLCDFVHRCLNVYDAVSCPMKDLLYECGRNYDTMSSLFSTAFWLQRSQSLLVQEIQPAKDIDLICCKTLPTKAITCLPMEPMFLEWPVALPPECEQPCPSYSHEDSNDDHLENTLPAPPHSRWRRDALQPHQIQHDTAGQDTCGHFPEEGLRCMTWNTGGLVGSGDQTQIFQEAH